MKKYFAELLGTFFLVFCGTGTAVMVGMQPESNVGQIGIAIAFGLAVISGAYALGHISGGHFNPAVSWAMLMDKRLSLKDFVAYSLAQILGGVFGSGMIWALFQGMKEPTHVAYAANGHGLLSPIGALLSETVLTFIFVFVILSVTKTKFIAPNLSVLIIGFTLILLHLVGMSLSGASVNPARSIGPALFTGGQAIAELWVYLVGPLLGATLAVYVTNYFEKD